MLRQHKSPASHVLCGAGLFVEERLNLWKGARFNLSLWMRGIHRSGGLRIPSSFRLTPVSLCRSAENAFAACCRSYRVLSDRQEATSVRTAAPRMKGTNRKNWVVSVKP